LSSSALLSLSSIATEKLEKTLILPISAKSILADDALSVEITSP